MKLWYAVGLPVGVGRERDRGVERQVGRHACELLGVERQQPLHPLQRVEHQQRDDAEEQQRCRVLGPAHAGLFINARHTVDQALERSDHRVEPGPLTGEEARHVTAEQRRHQRHRQQKEANLQPAVECHDRVLEPLRHHHRDDQVAEQGDADHERNEDFTSHGPSPHEAVADGDVAERDREEEDGDTDERDVEDVEDVEHRGASCLRTRLGGAA
jgi:hypothetical protein